MLVLLNFAQLGAKNNFNVGHIVFNVSEKLVLADIKNK